MEDLRVDRTTTIPARYLHAAAVHAGGPGGQNVNKLATKVVLVFDLPACDVLSGDVKDRLRSLAGRRIDRTGKLTVRSQRHRTRRGNLEECRARLSALVRQALEPPVRRRKTRPPQWTAAERLEAKRRQSRKKALRRPPSAESD